MRETFERSGGGRGRRLRGLLWVGCEVVRLGFCKGPRPDGGLVRCVLDGVGMGYRQRKDGIEVVVVLFGLQERSGYTLIFSWV